MTDHSQNQDGKAKILPFRTNDEGVRNALVQAETSLTATVEGLFPENGLANAVAKTLLLIVKNALAGASNKSIDDMVVVLVDILSLVNEIAADNATLRVEAQKRSEDTTLADELTALRGENATLTDKLQRLRGEHAALLEKDRACVGEIGAKLEMLCGELRKSVAGAAERQALERELAQIFAAKGEDTAKTAVVVTELAATLQTVAKALVPVTATPVTPAPIPAPAKTAIAPLDIDLKRIENEIELRNEWCVALSDAMVVFAEETTRPIKTRLEAIEEDLKWDHPNKDRLLAEQELLNARFRTANTETDRLLALEKTVFAQLETLEGIRQHLNFTRQKHDLSFLDQPLPNICVNKTPAPPKTTPAPEPETGSAAAGGRLPAIAEQFGMTRGAVLMATLFEILSSVVNPRTKKPMKSKELFRLLSAARTAGIIQRHGWNTVRDALRDVDGVEQQNAMRDRFVRFVFASDEIETYGRTGIKLAWQINEILTPGEIERFRKEIIEQAGAHVPRPK